MKKTIKRLISVLLVSLLILPPAIFNIDISALSMGGIIEFNSSGLGHGAPVPVNPLGDDVVFTGHGPASGATQWPAGYSGGFGPGLYDGKGKIWNAPVTSNMLTSVDILTGEMNGYTFTPENFAEGMNGFSLPSGSFHSNAMDDDGNIWLIPFGADRVVKFDPVTEKMTGYG